MVGTRLASHITFKYADKGIPMISNEETNFEWVCDTRGMKIELQKILKEYNRMLNKFETAIMIMKSETDEKRAARKRKAQMKKESKTKSSGSGEWDVDPIKEMRRKVANMETQRKILEDTIKVNDAIVDLKGKLSAIAEDIPSDEDDDMDGGARIIDVYEGGRITRKACVSKEDFANVKEIQIHEMRTAEQLTPTEQEDQPSQEDSKTKSDGDNLD